MHLLLIKHNRNLYSMIPMVETSRPPPMLARLCTAHLGCVGSRHQCSEYSSRGMGESKRVSFIEAQLTKSQDTESLIVVIW